MVIQVEAAEIRNTIHPIILLMISIEFVDGARVTNE
jgi:hypothetical protein